MRNEENYVSVVKLAVASMMIMLMMTIKAMAMTPEQEVIFTKVNAYRVEQGLPSLSENAGMKTAADTRALEITRKFSHKRPDDSEWFTADPNLLYGENLAKGYTPDQVVEEWIASESHKRNILSSEFKTMYISVINLNGTLYMVQEFGI